jgi:simple sugar transport system ATP-binding protein
VTAVRVQGLTRRFGEVTALDGANLSVRAGEVHGVLGENGAGKTTLLSILAGLVRPDAGEIEVDGRSVQPASPREARELGIGMVHQHFALVPRLSVLENLMLGWPGGLLTLPEEEVRRRSGSLMAETGLEVHLEAPVESLGVGERQRVEILKVLLQEPGVLIMDEPTAVLSPPEVRGLLELIRTLAASGTSVLLVAHKLDEVLAVADRVTVLRRGRTVLEAERSEVDAHTLASAMVGEALVARAESAGADPLRPGQGSGAAAGRSGAGSRGGAEPVAVLEGASLGTRLAPVSLRVFPGEIVGVAGVEGNGQRQLARILAGVERPDQGSARLPAEPAFIPQDRRAEGLVEDFDLAENLALRLRGWPEFRKGFLLDWAGLRRRAAEAMEEFGIRADGPTALAATLSGGNQQRLVLARELASAPRFVVAENPTRGLDVAGEAFVHGALRSLRDNPENPAGIVLISTDLDEVMALADRHFVMVRGELREVPPGPELRERIGRAMLGADG